MIKIGKKISRMRRWKGMTQEELAERMGVSRQTIFRWETDAMQPTLDKVQMLCSVLGVDLLSFLKEEDDENAPEKEGAGGAEDALSPEETSEPPEEKGGGEQSKASKEEKRGRIRWLIAVLIGAVLLVAGTGATILTALVAFSSNVGNTSVTTSGLGKGAFFGLLFATLVVCAIEVGLILKFLRKKGKM